MRSQVKVTEAQERFFFFSILAVYKLAVATVGYFRCNKLRINKYPFIFYLTDEQFDALYN